MKIRQARKIVTRVRQHDGDLYRWPWRQSTVKEAFRTVRRRMHLKGR